MPSRKNSCHTVFCCPKQNEIGWRIYASQWNGISYPQKMACRLIGIRPIHQAETVAIVFRSQCFLKNIIDLRLTGMAIWYDTIITGSRLFRGPLLLTWFNSTWISNYNHYNVWDEISYPFPNFNGATVEVWEWISNFAHTSHCMWLFIHAGIKVNPC